MKTLVVGSEGFLGRHLMEQGRVMGHEMVGCDIVGEPTYRSRAEFLDDRHLEGVDRVIHSAGVLGTSETIADPIGAVGMNISAVLKVLATCQKCAVPFTYLTLGNDWLNPYSITKNCAAEFVRMYNVVHGLPTQVAICYNVFGPHQKWKPVRKIVPEFMTKILSGGTIELFDDGEQVCDMVYAPDLARAILENATIGTQHYGSGDAKKVGDVLFDCTVALAMEVKQCVTKGTRSGETGPAAIAPYPINNQTNYQQAMKITADWYREAFKNENNTVISIAGEQSVRERHEAGLVI